MRKLILLTPALWLTACAPSPGSLGDACNLTKPARQEHGRAVIAQGTPLIKETWVKAGSQIAAVCGELE